MNSVIGRLPLGLSRTGGVIMGTRCGDLDPGVLVYLMRERTLIPRVSSGQSGRRRYLVGINEG